MRFCPWLLVLALSQIVPTRAPAPHVTCRVVNDARARVFVLSQVETREGKLWHLSLSSQAPGPRSVRLALPGAKPVFGPGSAKLSYRNANGGRMVELDVSPRSSALDVFVSHGLEVNIDSDLDPDVDELNTDGRLANLRCEVVEK